MRKSLIKRASINNNTDSKPLSNSILISGGCYPLKGRVIANLDNQKVKTIVINFDETSDYLDAFTPNYEYHISDSFSYANIFTDLTMRDASRLVRDRASDFGYSHSEIGQLLKYFDLINTINIKLNLTFDSLVDINNYFYNPNVVQDCLEEISEMGKMSRVEHDILETALYRSIGGHLFLENILAEIKFDINFDADGFSLSRMRNDESAMLDLSWRHSNSVSDSTSIKALLYDIECYKEPLVVVINLGSSDVVDISSSLKSLLRHTNIKLILIADDIFAQTDDTHKFIKGFNYNALGSHITKSAMMMSELFPLITKIEYHNACTYNRRLLSEHIIDKLLGKDYTEAITRVPVQHHELESKEISELSPNSFVLIDNTQRSNSRYSFQTI